MEGHLRLEQLEGIKDDRKDFRPGFSAEDFSLFTLGCYSLPERVRAGVLDFFRKKGIDFSVQQIENFLSNMGRLTYGEDYFKSNSFKYMIDSQNFDEVAYQILMNMSFLIEVFGMDFFARSLERSKNRKMFYQVPIEGTGCYLSCKGGSGAGTFSVDFAIGIDKGQSKYISGELWRLGFDTYMEPGGARVGRIIKSGSGVSKKKDGYDEKSEAFHSFLKETGILPQRALGFLTLYVMQDLGLNAARSVALETARNKKMSLNPGAGINFDYDKYACGLGFQDGSEDGWHQVDDLQAGGLYRALVSRGRADAGLKRQEVEGLDRVLSAFFGLGEKGCPLTICSLETRQELELAVLAAREISGRG